MLEVQHLTKTFKDFVAVDDITFSAHGGEIFGLLGPNGAGKTTTIRVIATILEATSGTARIKGFDIKTNSEDVRKHIGLLTADIGLYDRFTARENLRYFGRLYGMDGQRLEARIDELIDLLDMKRFADRKAGKFSTGMKQKVAIARSVIHDPDVIIFDEPTSGLDVLASQTVIRFMKRMRDAGKLVVLSTHDMAHAQSLCDRVGIIHRSKLIALDSVETILTSHHVSTLEEAFVNIVGDDEAKAQAKAEEHKALGKKTGATPQIKMDSKKMILAIRIVSLVMMGVGVVLRLAYSENESTLSTLGLVLVIVGAIGVVATNFLRKKYLL